MRAAISTRFIDESLDVTPSAFALSLKTTKITRPCLFLLVVILPNGHTGDPLSSYKVGTSSDGWLLKVANYPSGVIIDGKRQVGTRTAAPGKAVPEYFIMVG